VLVNPYYRHHGASNISLIPSPGSRASRSLNQDNRLCHLAHHLEPATQHITGWLRTHCPNIDTLHHTYCRVAPAPSPPLHTRAPPLVLLAYKTPTSSLSSYSAQRKTLLIKSPLSNHKQLHFPLPHT
jgi:hypothetical protein